jgi:hypothetical protein
MSDRAINKPPRIQVHCARCGKKAAKILVNRKPLCNRCFLFVHDAGKIRL